MHVQRIAHTLPGVVCRRADRRHGAAHALEVVVARNRELDVVRGPLEETDIQKLLQFGDLVADRRRRQMQLACSKGEIAASGHGFEGCKACKRRKG